MIAMLIEDPPVPYAEISANPMLRQISRRALRHRARSPAAEILAQPGVAELQEQKAIGDPRSTTPHSQIRCSHRSVRSARPEFVLVRSAGREGSSRVFQEWAPARTSRAASASKASVPGYPGGAGRRSLLPGPASSRSPDGSARSAKRYANGTGPSFVMSEHRAKHPKGIHVSLISRHRPRGVRQAADVTTRPVRDPWTTPGSCTPRSCFLRPALTPSSQ